MTTAALRHFSRRPLLALALLCSGAGALAAQGIVSGRVTDQANGSPLIGARVVVVGTSSTTTTNAEGRYRLADVPAGTQQVRASQIGYASILKGVTVANQATATVDFVLVLTPFSLDEVVVTATGDMAKREVGNAVSTLDAAPLVQTTAVSNINDLLVAKAPGVQVLPGSTTGTGGRVRIRGNSSLSLSNNPIYIIDGVRMTSSVNQMTIGIGGSSPSRVNDLNPEDIESIDVVRGPSASSLYGTDAANGVIVIKTKKGKAGRATWNTYLEQGFIRDENTYPIAYRGWRNTSTVSNTTQCLLSAVVTTNAAARCAQDSVSSYNLWKDPESSPLGTGYRNQIGAQVSGGSDAVRYYLSTEWEKEVGLLHMPRAFEQRILATRAVDAITQEQSHPNRLRRVNVRANIAANLNDKMDVQISSGFLTSSLRLPQIDNNAFGIGSNGFGGPGFKNFMLVHVTGQTARNNLGWRSATPDETFSMVHYQDVNRAIPTGTFNYRPTSWLSMRATAGLDFTSQMDTELCRRDECPNIGTALTGFKNHNRTTIFAYTGDVAATANYKLGGFGARSIVGTQYNKDNLTQNFAYAENLVPGATTVSAGSIPLAGEGTTTSITLGFYGEQQMAWKNRVYLSGSVRSDKNSAFGKQFKRVYYPKASVSYVISDEPFFPKTSFLSSFRLRAAFGASGRQPGQDDAILFFTPVTTKVDAAADTPGLVLSALGNPTLKPERSQEVEAGFDASFGNNRVNFEFTFYNKSSRDALISRIIAPSAGTAASRFENIGEVRNRGVEGSINAIIVDAKSFGWELTANGSYNQNKIVSLGGLPPSIGTTNSDKEGYPVQGWWMRPYTYKDVNGDGIIQGDTATAVRELFVGDTNVYVGPPLPPAEFSAYTTFHMFNRKLEIQGLFDAKVGGYQLNGTERIRCQTRQNCRGDVDPKAPLSEQARAIAVRVHPSATQYGYVEKSNMIRFRELSLTFTLPDRWAHYFSASNLSFTAAGRNLGIITGYSGIDPEGGYFGTNIGVQSDFQTPPPPTYYTFRLNVRF